MEEGYSVAGDAWITVCLTSDDETGVAVQREGQLQREVGGKVVA